MTISSPENKISLVEVNNYGQGKISYLKQSASSENIPSPTSNFVPVFTLGLHYYTTETWVFCVSLCGDLINHEGA